MKEAKNQRKKEMSDLEQQIQDEKDRKTTKQDELERRGNDIREAREQAHIKRKGDLEQEIAKLEAKHREIKDGNVKREEQLNLTFDQLEKTFQSNLEQYDQEMYNQSEEKAGLMREYDEQHKELT